MPEPSLWTSVPPPYRACIEEAWSAYRAGSLPIGAVVTDPHGNIVARGRNRIHETSGEDGTLFGHKLSHAELNALVSLDYSSHDASELHLLTTTEPCPLCVGALRMSDVTKLSYAARDPWAGSTSMFETVPYLKRGGIEVTGPVDRTLEDALIAVQISHFLRSRPPVLKRFVARYSEVVPAATRAGILLHETRTLEDLAGSNATASEMLDAASSALRQIPRNSAE